MIRFLTFSSFFIVLVAFSQGRRPPMNQAVRDSIRLDSLCRLYPSQCMNFSELVGSNAIFNHLVPRRINLSSQICFDKKVNYTIKTGTRIEEKCFYLNTQLGYTAEIQHPRSSFCGSLGNNISGLKIQIASIVGETFLFEITTRGEKVFSSTMPLEDIPYGARTIFFIKEPQSLINGNRYNFTDQNLPTLPYKLDVALSSERYFYGFDYKPELFLNDYFGHNGLGYYKDDYNKTFVCLRLKDDQIMTTIDKIADVAECFDPHGFTELRGQAVEQNREIISNREEELRKKEEENDGACQSASRLLHAHERVMIDQEKRVNDLMSSGANLHSIENQLILAKAADPMLQVKKRILEIEVRICRLRNTIARTSGDNARNNEKLSCYTILLSKYRIIYDELEEIGRRYSSNPSKALTEKSRLYSSRLSTLNDRC